MQVKHYDYALNKHSIYNHLAHIITTHYNAIMRCKRPVKNNIITRTEYYSHGKQTTNKPTEYCIIGYLIILNEYLKYISSMRTCKYLATHHTDTLFNRHTNYNEE